jgi:hypothetical protein
MSEGHFGALELWVKAISGLHSDASAAARLGRQSTYV